MSQRSDTGLEWRVVSSGEPKIVRLGRGECIIGIATERASGAPTLCFSPSEGRTPGQIVPPAETSLEENVPDVGVVVESLISFEVLTRQLRRIEQRVFQREGLLTPEDVCPMCDERNSVIVYIGESQFHVGSLDGDPDNPPFQVTARVPVHVCSKCDELWTGGDAEEIRNRAVEMQTPYRRTQDGRSFRYDPELHETYRYSETLDRDA